jgi:hypothetical protein
VPLLPQDFYLEKDQDEDASDTHDVLLPTELVHVFDVLLHVVVEPGGRSHTDLEAQDVLDLAYANSDGCSRHESSNDRMAKELHEPAHPQQTNASVHAGHKEANPGKMTMTSEQEGKDHMTNGYRKIE